jgi:inhibitor of cysteine peptidase
MHATNTYIGSMKYLPGPKRGFLIGLLLSAVALLGAGCGNDKAAEVRVDEANDGETIEIDSGGTLIVSLPSNPTTGYAWSISDPTGGLEQQGSAQYVPASTTTPLLGSAGTEVFRFKARSAGEYNLSFAYARSFEPNVPPIDTFRITVKVQ